MAEYASLLRLVCTAAALCVPFTGVSEIIAVTPEVAAGNALAAFAKKAIAGTTVHGSDTYRVYEPDRRAILESGRVVVSASGYFVLVRGTMQPSEVSEDMNEEEGVLAQFRCGPDGKPCQIKVFTQPIEAFGRIGLGEDEAKQRAAFSTKGNLGKGRLIEIAKSDFLWEFPDGTEKHYVDTLSGDYFTEWEVCLRLAPRLAQVPDLMIEAVLRSPFYILEDARQAPIQMCQDRIAIIPNDTFTETSCAEITAKYSDIQSFEELVFPESCTPRTKVWLLIFIHERSYAEIQQIAQEFWQQETVAVACPVFRQQSYGGKVFDFMLMYYMTIVARLDTEQSLGTILNQDERLEIRSKRQWPPAYPARYLVRAKKGAVSASEFIELSNQYYADNRTKYVFPTKLILHHPAWDQAEFEQGE